MNRRIAIMVLLMLLTAVSVARASSHDPGLPIFVTPTAIEISLAVTPASVDYGAVIVGQSAVSPVITVTNQSNVNVNVGVYGNNACEYDPGTGQCKSGGVVWDLAAAPGANAYVHEFVLGSDPSVFTPLTLSSQSLVSGLAPQAGETFNLRITLPSQYSTLPGQMVTQVDLLATQS